MAKINYDQNKIRPAYSSVNFHIQINYLGSVWYVKKKFWNIEIIFNYIAENSVKKMLDGKQYERALRAHELLSRTLKRIIFNRSQLVMMLPSGMLLQNIMNSSKMM